MDNIYKYFRDPGWWFSAFVVAILASIIAGFAKDYVEKRFGFFLARSRTRRSELQNKRARLIAAWSASEALVILAFLQMLYSFAVFAGAATLVVVYLSYLRLQYGFTGIEQAAVLPVRTALVLAVATLVLVATAVSTVRIVSVTVDILNSFRRKRDLPSFVGEDNWLW